jgi:hypothetical protein
MRFCPATTVGYSNYNLVYSAPYTVAFVFQRLPSSTRECCYDRAVLSDIKSLGEMAYLAAKAQVGPRYIASHRRSWAIYVVERVEEFVFLEERFRY